MKFKKIFGVLLVSSFMFSGCGSSSDDVFETTTENNFIEVITEKNETTTVETTITTTETTTEETTTETTTAKITTTEATTKKVVVETTTVATTAAKASSNVSSSSSKTSSVSSSNSSSNYVSDDSVSETVYIGKTGTKYHRKGCFTLKGKGRPISLTEAKQQGRAACKKCY